MNREPREAARSRYRFLRERSLKVKPFVFNVTGWPVLVTDSNINFFNINMKHVVLLPRFPHRRQWL